MKLFKILSKFFNKNASLIQLTNIKYNSKIIATKPITAAASAFAFALFYTYYKKISDNNNNNQIIKNYQNFIINQKNKFFLHAKEKNKQKLTEDSNSAVDFDNEEQSEETFTANNARKRIFFKYASVEYNGIPYMTPLDFIDSITFDRARPKTRRKVLKKADVDKYLKNTPQLKHNTTNFFRNLENKGLITYSEYIFLLCVITKPKSRFEIAFNMFDIDGNKWVDKREFLVIEKVFQNGKTESVETNTSKSIIKDEINNLVTKIFQRDTEKKIQNTGTDEIEDKKIIESLNIIDISEYVDTTLLIHLFGHKGKDVLYYTDFSKFMENLQTEILEVEFNEFAKGLNKISELEFAEILLRYTEFDEEKKEDKLNKLESEIEEYSRGITFESFKKFSSFMNNLDDFSLALKYHSLANKSISKNEFQRAVKISSGFELDDQIVDVIFRVFDEDNDESLSYKEFIAVMKDRIRRNPKSNKSSKRRGHEQTFSQEFKTCMRNELHDDQYS